MSKSCIFVVIFHMSRMALGDRFAYINQHCGPLFSGLRGLMGRGGGPAWAGKGSFSYKSFFHEYM